MTLLNFFKKSGSPINFLDIGASDGPEAKWQPLFKYINYTAFEPNKVSFENIQSQLKDHFKELNLHNFALSDFNGEAPFFITDYIYCCSMLKPNERWLSRFEFSDFFRIKDETTVTVKRLDGIDEIQKKTFDVIKIDVQGAEIKVMNGGECYFKNAFFVETESGFNENYIGEATFNQIASFMSQNNYLLFDINHNHRIKRKNFNFGNLSNKAQPLWCEATWLKDLIKESEINEKFEISKSKLLCNLMICANNGFYDYAVEILKYFNDKFSFFSSEEVHKLMQEESWLI